MVSAAIGAKVIAKAKRDKEKAAKNAKEGDGTLYNENDLLRRRSTRMQRTRGAGFILQNYQMLAENKEIEEEPEVSKTSKLYTTLLESEEYLLSMQPYMLEDSSGDDDEIGMDEDLLEIQSAKAEAANLSLIRQMTSNLS